MTGSSKKLTEFESKSLEETEKIAGKFLEGIKQDQGKEKINVVGLKGDLGLGKTVFVKCIGKGLRIKEIIQSPTFVIQRSYDTGNPVFKKFYHLDLYRIEDAAELKIFRLDEIFEDKSNLVLIEWSERAQKGSSPFIFPSDMINIDFEFMNVTTRKISYTI